MGQSVRGLIIGLAAVATAFAAYGCGRAQDEAPPPRAEPPPFEFQPTQMDFDRPCTLLTPTDASDVLKQPFFRTIATDSVEGARVRCAQAVGEGGLQGVIELFVQYPLEGQTAELAFLSLCRTETEGSALLGVAMQTQPTPQTAQRPVSAAPSDVAGRACQLSNGGYALLLPDRVLRMQVRDSAGVVEQQPSHSLARLVSRRVAAQRR